jgi:hypothetical protein
MADQYEVESQDRTLHVTGVNTAVDVMQVGARTKPHGVPYTVLVPYQDWLQGYAAFSLGGQAAFIEGAFSESYVLGAVGVQDTNPVTGLLDYFVDFTLEVPAGQGKSGPMRTVVRIQPSVLPLAIDYGVIFGPYLDALNATAGL